MTDDSVHGLATAVYAEILGDQLTVAASSGATVLTVNDVGPFAPAPGYVQVNGVVYAYTDCDDDANTVTLATGLTAAAAVDDRVDLYDQANKQPAVVYNAIVGDLDGFSDPAPVEATVPDGLVGALQEQMVDGNGVSVVLERDGSELQVSEILGRLYALATTQYLQGGFTTRQSEDTAGIDITELGIQAFDTSGIQTAFIDALTGNTAFSVQDTAIAAAQTAANGKNTVHYATTTPGSTANIAGDLWFQQDGSGNIIGQWTGTGGTSWASNTLTNSVISTLDAGKITTGTLAAARIASKSISADQLAIGFGSNFIRNPGFEDGTTTPHVITATSGGITTANIRSGAKAGALSPPARAAGSYAYDLTFNGSRFDTTGKHLPVQQDDTILGSVYIRNNGVTGATVKVFIDFFDATGTSVLQVAGNVITVSASYQLSSVTATAPATAAFVSMSVAAANTPGTGNYFIDDAILTKQVTGSLIVNGAIDGKTITAPVIQTATTGQRMVIANDVAGGVIKFWTGAAGETGPGYINPLAPGSDIVLAIASPPSATVPSLIQLQAGAVGYIEMLSAVQFDQTATFSGRINANSGLSVATSSTINKLDWGIVSGTTNASGQVTFSHSMGVTPSAIFWQDDAGNHPHRGYVLRSSSTSTTFTVQFRNSTSDAATGSGVGVSGVYMAVA